MDASPRSQAESGKQGKQSPRDACPTIPLLGGSLFSIALEMETSFEARVRKGEGWGAITEGWPEGALWQNSSFWYAINYTWQNDLETVLSPPFLPNPQDCVRVSSELKHSPNFGSGALETQEIYKLLLSKKAGNVRFSKAPSQLSRNSNNYWGEGTVTRGAAADSQICVERAWGIELWDS